jgi:hypothetical protein
VVPRSGSAQTGLLEVRRFLGVADASRARRQRVLVESLAVRALPK